MRVAVAARIARADAARLTRKAGRYRGDEPYKYEHQTVVAVRKED
jgi:hypothetical protein